MPVLFGASMLAFTHGNLPGKSLRLRQFLSLQSYPNDKAMEKMPQQTCSIIEETNKFSDWISIWFVVCLFVVLHLY